MTVSEKTLWALDTMRRKVAEQARLDPVVFCKFVLRDEESGSFIDLAPMHVEWQDLLSRHDRVLLLAAVESGKSAQISVGRVLWEIGRNPRIRIALLSATEGGARKIVTLIARYILQSPEYHMVFPHVRPSTRHGEGWTETRITVDRGDAYIKEPTIQAAGHRGHIHGSRIDLGVVDDVNDYANTATEQQREEVFSWVGSQLMNRLTREARLWFLGNVWHRRDVIHRLEGRPGYVSRRYPAHDKRSGQFAWPERYDAGWLAKKRADLVTPSNIDRMIYCHLGPEDGKRVQWAWIQRALDLGRGRRLAHALNSIPVGYSIYTGVDLAVQERDDNDLTAFSTIAVDSAKRRHLLWVEAGHWGGPQTLDRLYQHKRRYESPVFMIENVAAQDFLIQFARKDARGPLSIIPYTTGKTKADPRFGIESMAVEMGNGWWSIPNQSGDYENPEVGHLLSELDNYSPTAHTGDRLMSLFLAREAAQRGNSRVESGTLDTTSR